MNCMERNNNKIYVKFTYAQINIHSAFYFLGGSFGNLLSDLLGFWRLLLHWEISSL